VTEEITVRQPAAGATSAVPSGQQGITGGARCGAERTAPEINPYLYENWSAISKARSSTGLGMRLASQIPTPPGRYAPKPRAWAMRFACSARLNPSFVN
jgi:hypothetical protein